MKKANYWCWLALMPTLAVAQSVATEGVSRSQETPTIAPFGSEAQEAVEMKMPGTEQTVQVKVPQIQTPVPLMEAVTGYTDSGLPISRYRRMTLDMAHKFAAIMRKNGVQGTQRDVWAEQEAEIAKREAREGRTVTQHFIIPGTTPEQSKTIHDNHSAGWTMTSGQAHYVLSEQGKRTVSDEQGKLKESEERQQRQQQSIAPAPCGGNTCPISDLPRLGKTLPFVPDNERLGKTEKNAPGVNHQPGGNNDQSDKSAEERLLEFFPDLKYQQSRVSDDDLYYLKWFLNKVVPVAQAAPGSNAWTLQDVEAIAKDNEKLRRTQTEEKDSDGEERQKFINPINPEAAAMQRAKILAGEVLEQSRSYMNDMNVLDEQAKDERSLSTAENQNHDAATRTYVFVSYSLKEKALKNILVWAGQHPQVTVVMRGVPPGMNLGQGIRRMQDLAVQCDPMPNIILDPTLFDAYAVKAVPTVVLTKNETPSCQGNDPDCSHAPTMLAKVEGLDNDRWLKERVEHGSTGDLGQQGDIFAIEEPHLIQELQKRIQAKDWEAEKQAAMKRFWDKQNFVELPWAKETRTWTLDPSVLATSDILDADGRVLVKAGTMVNPLSVAPVPWSLALLVIDPLQKEQVTWAKNELAKLKNDNRYSQVMVLATRMNRTQGWDFYEQLQDELDHHIYLLMPDLKRRFNLQAVPSKVTADNARSLFIIEEYAVDAVSGEQEK